METNSLSEYYNYISEYILQNWIGLLLLIFSFFIIYFVDYITFLNTFTSYPQIPIQLNKPKQRKKTKK